MIPIKRTTILLNAALEWNISALPNNTIELQIKKIDEELREVMTADNAHEMIKELADVFIAIGGLARFDERMAAFLLACYFKKFAGLNRLVYKEIPKKIKILYQRDYSNGYHHRERC